MPPPGACNLVPETAGALFGPFASGATVLQRISLFLENGPPDPNATADRPRLPISTVSV